MAFNNAHHINVHTLYAWDNSRRGGESVFSLLERAACLGATHHSDERFDPPKCHPETRQAVLNDILSWVNAKDPKERIMWLSGPVGTGKSAIAQTVAEICDDENKLVSSFFFSRTATTGRDDGARLIPTIAYQLAVAIPETKELITAVLERDPAILKYSKEKQFKQLIIEPLAQAITHISSDNMAHIPELVIIDGLDECHGPEVQSAIINVIAGVFSRQAVRLRFLVASRPELDIRKAFALPSAQEICLKLNLEQLYDANKDIETYLQSEFNTIKRMHPLAYTGLSNDLSWPSSDDLTTLVIRSSGQFIYASTVIKYLMDDHHDPKERLHLIIHTLSVITLEDSPYTQLDVLYTHILSSAVTKSRGYEIIKQIFQVLTYVNHNEPAFNPPAEMASFLRIKESLLYLQLLDLHSVVRVPIPDSTDPKITFFHASFKDYLIDRSRSKEFFIAEAEAHVALAHYCLSTILKNPKALSWGEGYANRNYFYHLNKSGFDDNLLNELRGQNVKLVATTVFSEEPDFFADILSNLIKFDYVNSVDFGFPVTKKIEDIFNFILSAVEEFILMNFKPNFETYFKSVLIILWKQRNIQRQILPDEIRSYWRAMMMEDPARGKDIYLSNAKCEEAFHKIVEGSINGETDEFYSICGAVCYRNHYEDWLPAVLTYLLERIRPSMEFGTYLLDARPNLTGLVDKYTKAENYYCSGFDYENMTQEKILEDVDMMKKVIDNYLEENSKLEADNGQ